MDTVIILLLIAAAVCFVLAAWRIALRLELVALGLLFLTLTWLVPTLATL